MKLTILNSSNKFSELIDDLQLNFDKIAFELRACFDVETLDVTISPFGVGEAPSSGIGGWAINSYRIEILLDTDRHDVKKVICSELAAVLAHEVNHIERMKLKLPDSTLAENLVYEGLACHFEQRFNGGMIPSLFKGMEGMCWKSMLSKMEPMLDSKDFHFNDYFCCDDSSVFPKYAGYWVGFNLVAKYVEAHGVSEEVALSLPAEVFFEKSV
ncbi:hypothetical protein HYO43_23835 [Vibrio parahaemolyticus]|nr:hypothetical protein [Vibrio parahaemolyticus]